jgi:alpha-glucosidase (family GH31 glycosyl hydrolase)
MQQATTTGVPALRPLFLDFTEDARTAKVDDDFLFGDDLPVAPVFWEEADGMVTIKEEDRFEAARFAVVF